MNTRTYHGIKVYNGILEQLKHIHDTEVDSFNEVRHYANEFPKEVDFNLAQYGNLLVYYNQIHDFYKACEYPLIERMETDELWEMYKKDVGYVATHVVSSEYMPLPVSMYRLKVVLNEPSTTIPIMEWIKSHKKDAERLDHTVFMFPEDRMNCGIVSVHQLNTTLEESVSWFDAKAMDVFEYKGMRRFNSTIGYYFEIDRNVYFVTF